MSDHRQLGRELELFATDPLIGAGLPVWLPAGAAVRHAVEEYVHQAERRAGYRHVYSPPLGKRELYELSGHWEHYRDEMFPPMALGGERFLLRPSLCPHHLLVYRARQRSHRDLPVRIAELGGMYRAERSGVLGGLSRVRAISLNDAHVFCREEQIAAEVSGVLDMVGDAYRALGLHAHRYRLSLRGDGDKYVADPAMWARAEAALRSVLDARGIGYDAERGEAAFYGPKIDIQLMDPAGRELTLSTVQLDFHMPARFNLSYVDAGGEARRPVMIHRSVVGGLERLMAHLIEVYDGAFPVWLAPVQVAVLPVGAGAGPAAEAMAAGAAPAAAAMAAACLDAGLRAEVATEGTLGARIRAARLVPYAAILGEREAAAGQVSLRLRDGRRLPPQPVGKAVGLIAAVASSRSLALLPEGVSRSPAA